MAESKPNMSLTDVSVRNAVESAIIQAVKESVQAIVNEEIDAAVNQAEVKVRHRICELADTIALKMLRLYNVEMMGDKLIVEVRKPGPDTFTSPE